MNNRGHLRAVGLSLASFLLLFFLTLAVPAAALQSELIDHYRRAIELDPDNPALHYYLGISLLENGAHAAAIDEFRQAYPAYYDSLEMNYNFGLAHARLNDVENALLYLDLADTLGARTQLEIYPIDRVYFNLVLTLLERGETSEAQRLLRKVLELDPQQVDAHNLLGDLLAKSGETDAALQEFLVTLSIDPQNDPARDYLFALHYNRALQFIDQKRYEEARPELHTALSYKPDKIVSYYYLGYLDYLAMRYPEAVTSLLNITATAPEEIRKNLLAMLYNSGLALLEQKNIAAAEPVAAYLLGQPAPAARDYFLAANIKLAASDYATASELYRKTLQVDPSHRGAALNLLTAQKSLLEQEFRAGKERFAAQDYPQALAHFEKILAIDAGYPQTQQYVQECRLAIDRVAATTFAQAEQLLGAGDTANALTAVRQGLTLLPDSPRGKSLEETLLEAIRNDIERDLQQSDNALAAGDLSAAEAGYRRILALQPDNPRALAGVARTAAARDERQRGLEERFHRLLVLEQAGEANTLLVQMEQLAPAATQNRLLRTKLDNWLDQQIEAKTRAGRRAFAENRSNDGKELFLAALALRDTPSLRNELTALASGHARKYAELSEKFHALLAAGDFKKSHSYLQQLAALTSDPSAAQKLKDTYAAAVAEACNRHLATAAAKATAKNWRGALSDYRLALDLEPSNTRAQEGLRQGKAQLQHELQQLVEQAQVLAQKGHLEQAEKTYRKALDLDPYEQSAKSGLTRLAQVKQSGARPGDENALYLQGIDLYTRGRYSEAVALWEKVLILAPKHDKARMNIEKAQRKIEQIKAYRNE